MLGVAVELGSILTRGTWIGRCYLVAVAAAKSAAYVSREL